MKKLDKEIGQTAQQTLEKHFLKKMHVYILTLVEI